MDAMKCINGTCLCGSVLIQVNPKENRFDACHCNMCRKWSGGPALTIDGGDEVKFKGEEYISIYQSSAWAERGFCKKCGTHLFYRLKNSSYCNFPMGLFKETEKFQFNMQIFIDSKPECYEFANKTETMTEAEVVAKFGPPPVV